MAAGFGPGSSRFSAGVPSSGFQATMSSSFKIEDFDRVTRAACAPSPGSKRASSAKTRALVPVDTGQDSALSPTTKTVVSSVPGEKTQPCEHMAVWPSFDHTGGCDTTF